MSAARHVEFLTQKLYSTKQPVLCWVFRVEAKLLGHKSIIMLNVIQLQGPDDIFDNLFREGSRDIGIYFFASDRLVEYLEIGKIAEDFQGFGK